MFDSIPLFTESNTVSKDIQKIALFFGEVYPLDNSILA